MIALLVLLGVLVAVLAVAYAVDRKDRRHGLGRRASGGIWRDARDANRDARAMAALPNAMSSRDTRWTAHTRRGSSRER
ncbi:MAG: hypothetical protein ACRDVG_12480 [Jatrophihabitantaceae bacterium]